MMSSPFTSRLTRLVLTLPLLGALPAAGQTVNEDSKLTASDPMVNAYFGNSIAISGTTVIVGAGGDEDVGSAYLFDMTTGTLLFKLTASDGEEGDNFGRSMAISGTTAIVGAYQDDDRDVGNDSGSAYIFDTTTGLQLFKLTASDAEANDYFGSSVAISGTIAIIGARGSGDFLSGSAYIFDTTTGAQIIKLTASDAAHGDIFGYSVAISGTTAIVGANGDDDGGGNSGSAYLFDLSDLGDIKETKLTASDAAGFDQFGRAVAISGTIAIVGAYGDDDGGSSSGSAYVFDLTPSCPADLTGDGSINFFDVSVFLNAFNAMNPIADFTGDGQLNFFDVSAFLSAFNAGCP